MYVTPEYFVGISAKNQKLIAYRSSVAFEQRVVDIISECLGVTKEQITSKKRTRDLAEARCIAIGIILERFPNFGLKKLGAFFGGRDHSTIIYNKDLYKDLWDTNKQFRYKASLILKGL